MADTPFAQPGLLLAAVNCTGDNTVAPLIGLDTVTLPGVPGAVKVALTDAAALSVIEQLVPVPQPPPLQLENE
jgi:hypothetical protein